MFWGSFQSCPNYFHNPTFQCWDCMTAQLSKKSKPLELSSFAIILAVKVDCPESVKKCIYFVRGTD